MGHPAEVIGNPGCRLPHSDMPQKSNLSDSLVAHIHIHPASPAVQSGERKPTCCLDEKHELTREPNHQRAGCLTNKATLLEQMNILAMHKHKQVVSSNRRTQKRHQIKRNKSVILHLNKATRTATECRTKTSFNETKRITTCRVSKQG